MSSSSYTAPPDNTHLCFVFDYRMRQLRKWGARASKTLHSIPEESLLSEGAAALRDMCQHSVGLAHDALDMAESDRLASGDWSTDWFEHQLFRPLDDAHNHLMAIEGLHAPVLRSRDWSDPRYDRLVHMIVRDEIRIRKLVPLICRYQQLDSPLKVCPWFGHGVCIFLWYPSIRSFDSLSLLFHEIGHALWWLILSPVAPDIPHRLQRIGDVRNLALAVCRNQDWVDELIADAFAGLLGGFAYVSSLAATLISRGNDWTQERSSVVHPGPFFRVHLAREAAVVGECPLINSDDALCQGWNALNRLRRDTTYPRNLDEIETTALERFLRALRRLAEDIDLSLIGDVRLPQSDSDESPPLEGTEAIRALLLAAARYRSATSFDRRYVDWEKKALPALLERCATH